MSGDGLVGTGAAEEEAMVDTRKSGEVCELSRGEVGNGLRIMRLRREVIDLIHGARRRISLDRSGGKEEQ